MKMSIEKISKTKEEARSVDTKICNKCFIEKSIFLFTKNKRSTCGFENRCKECAAKNTVKWKEENPEKAYQVFLNGRKWDQENKTKHTAYKSKCRAKRRKRLVDWDQDLTVFVVEEAHNLRNMRDHLTGIEWHVDHIIPLVGKKVSGLHVWNNLQVIPAKINLRKNNRYDLI